jgi:Ca2+-binding RTX toxin-like protein
MAKHILKHDGDATWNINQDADKWILAANAKISVSAFALSDGYGIRETNVYKHNVIDVRGDISVTEGQTNWGVYSEGESTDVRVRSTCSIEATSGVYAAGAQSSIVNRADMTMTSYGLYLAGDGAVARNYGDLHVDAGAGLYSTGEGAKIFNYGDIDAATSGIAIYKAGSIATNFGTVNSDNSGVFLGTGATLVNQESGVVVGTTAVHSYGSDVQNTVINKGMIAGSDYAYFGQDSVTDHIVNQGTMVGTVSLGAGNDYFDTLGGKLIGKVTGGMGDDIIVTDDWQIKYTEDAGQGTDTVKSTVTFTLGNNIENLILIGEGIAWGVGNGLDNSLLGNSADNMLFGNGGSDTLDGAAGNDTLTGGTGGDTFVFNKGHDSDTISQFVDGEDIIYLSDFAGIDSFADLNGKITQAQPGADVIIDFGDGDTLTIKGVDLVDLNDDDFLM